MPTILTQKSLIMRDKVEAMRHSSLRLYFVDVLSAVSKHAHFSSSFDFARNHPLVLGTGTSLFARQDFILATHKVPQRVAISKGNFRDISGAEKTNCVTRCFFHKLKRDIFNTNFFFSRNRTHCWLLHLLLLGRCRLHSWASATSRISFAA